MHLYFNVIGTVIFMALFYGLHAVLPFAFLENKVNAAGIAAVHTAFNLFATVLLLPFSRMLEKLAWMTIKDEERSAEIQNREEDTIPILDPRFLATPGFALEQCRTAAMDMAEFAVDALFTAMGLMNHYDGAGAEKVVRLEEKVDRYEDELGSYLVKLSSRNLSEKDSHTLSFLLHNIGDFERISDHALNVKEAAGKMHVRQCFFSSMAEKELAVFAEAVKEIMESSLLVFKNEDMQLAKKIEPLEETIDYLNAEIKKRHISRLREGSCTIEMGFILADVTTSYERVADHCSNIAVSLLEIAEDGFDTHAYLGRLRRSENIGFMQAVEGFREKYRLP